MARLGELVRIGRFAVVGAANTLVGLLAVYACKAAGLGDVPANALGYAIGLANSFVWNRRWTFAHAGEPLAAIGRFLAVFLGAWLVNLAVVVALLRSGVDAHLAHAVGIAPYTVLFYVGCRRWAFRDPGTAG